MCPWLFLVDAIFSVWLKILTQTHTVHHSLCRCLCFEFVSWCVSFAKLWCLVLCLFEKFPGVKVYFCDKCIYASYHRVSSGTNLSRLLFFLFFIFSWIMNLNEIFLYLAGESGLQHIKQEIRFSSAKFAWDTSVVIKRSQCLSCSLSPGHPFRVVLHGFSALLFRWWRPDGNCW